MATFSPRSQWIFDLLGSLRLVNFLPFFDKCSGSTMKQEDILVNGFVRQVVCDTPTLAGLDVFG